MATNVSGPLRLVTDQPALLVQVMVRAPKPRPYAGGMVVDFTTPATVTDGAVSFPCVPGPAVLSVMRAGVPQITVPLVVPDKADASLEECMQAAGLADNATQSVLEDLARRIVEGVAAAEVAASKATEQAQTATEQAGIASSAAVTATEQAGVAAGSAGAAAVSEANAKTSEQAAKQSETSVKASEDRVATIAGSTRWVGTKLEVNGVLSPDLKGDLPVVYSSTPPEDKNVIWVNPDEELPEPTGGTGGTSGPVSWESVTGKPAEFTPAAHTHTVGQVDGLQTVLDGKAAASHNHTIADTTGLQAALDGKSSTSHVHAVADVTGLQAELDSKAPTAHTHAISNVTGLQSELDGKAATTHTHTPASIGAAAATHAHVIGDVAGLQGALDGKAEASHTHTASQISDATTTGKNVLTASSQSVARSAIGAGTSNLAIGTTSTTAAAGDHTHTPASIGAAPATHTHTTAQVTGLETALSGKANTSHTHAIGDVGGLQSALDGKVNASQIQIVPTIPSTTTPGTVYITTV